MAPIKFEEDIKSTIEKRTIQPSSNAWSKLEGSLNYQEKKNNKKVFLRLGVAATIIGVLWMAKLTFNTESKDVITPVIVNTQINIEDEPIEVVVQETNVEEILKSEKAAIKQPLEMKFKEQKVVIITSQKTEKEISIAETIIEKEVIVQIEVLEEINKTIEEQQIEEVVAQIVGLKEQNGAVTDVEINALLHNAQRKISQNKIYNQTSKTVDAYALLQDVEAELDPSFRKKVFDALKLNFDNVKTAVAQRNN